MDSEIWTETKLLIAEASAPKVTILGFPLDSLEKWIYHEALEVFSVFWFLQLASLLFHLVHIWLRTWKLLPKTSRHTNFPRKTRAEDDRQSGKLKSHNRSCTVSIYQIFNECKDQNIDCQSMQFSHGHKLCTQELLHFSYSQAWEPSEIFEALDFRLLKLK